MKKNNKGYTLVEVIVSFSLVMIVMVYLLKTIIVISEKNAELLLMQEYNVFESILLDKIYEDLDSVGNLTTISNENEITFNEINKSLKIDINNKSIIYDDIIYELPDNFEFKNDSYDVINIEDGKYLIININLNIGKKDKKLKIVHTPYKIETEIEDTYLSFVKQYIEQIQSNITLSAQEGLYYFDDDGNLDYGNGTKIDVDKGVKPIPKGNINIYNKKVTYACFSFGGYNFEYDYTKNEVFERSMLCSTTRGSNLVYNGDLSLNDNTNLTSLGEYKNGYIYNTTSTTLNNRSIDDLIPIDTNKTYNISVDMKSSNTTSTYYVGFREYDVDKNVINEKYVIYIKDTLTTLSKDLKDGDTVVYLNNLDNWNVNTGTKNYQRGFIIWNYKDSTGYQYPELTYSRNVFQNLYEDSNVNKKNNTIILNSPWSNGTVKAGTKLSQSNSSQSYNYRLIMNSPITTGWVNYNYSGITGITNTAVLNMDHFRAGSKYIRFTVNYNHNKTPDTTTYLRNININEVTN